MVVAELKRLEINVKERERKIISLAACAVMCLAGMTSCGHGDKKGSGAGHMYSAALA